MIRDDVVRSLFLLDSTAGILDLSLADGAGVDLPLVSTRTYNDAAGGTYGQSIPARDPLATIGRDDPSSLLLLPGLSKTAAFRSNAGLYNQSSGHVPVRS